jgi:ABC-type glycerol-3-phosphate transport system permease component
MLVGYLATVPKSLDEAAIIDGASRWQVIWRIVCPVMPPGFVATATYAFSCAGPNTCSRSPS